MTIRKKTQTMLLAAAIVAAACFTVAAAQGASTAAATAALTQEIPSDPQITVGTLANGLRYYIRGNKKPDNRAELRLVVNAGSNLEEDDQRGLAHFVEHMAFNGSKNFPKQAVVDFMQSIGMRFGAHVNAYTSFDETVFQLQIPTDKPEILDKSFLILEDWAHNISFDPAIIDKERGVITEEWRLGRGAAARMQDQQFPILLKDSRYAERLPIGKMEIVQHFKPERLTKFYADWYRPDLMAVVAVGDFDKAKIESEITQHFGALKNPAPEKPRPVFKVPEQPGTLYAIAKDKEADSTTVEVYAKMAARPQSSVGDYRRQIVEGLFSGMLSARLGELSQIPDAPFLGAGASRGAFVRTEDASTLTALVKEDGIARGLDALFTEAARVAQFGFTATELDRQKRELMSNLDQLVAEKDKEESSSFAAEFIRNFTTGEPIPGIVYESQLYQRFLPEISLAEVNALAKDWTPDRNRVVAINAPDKPSVVMPSEAQLSAVMASAAAKNLRPYVDTVDASPLLDPLPTPASIVKTTTQAAFGITEWELSNGVKVVLKPTTFKQDEILFEATSPGGTSLASDKDFIAAATASQVIGFGGLGKFAALDLTKMLAGKVANVQPTIGATSEGLSGNASNKDLETMFQLIYMTFTQPRADATMFGVMTSQMKTLLANQQAQPDFVFGTTLEGALTQNHPRAQPMTSERVDEMSLEQSMAFYKDRFADASGFRFVFVGSFDPVTLKPLVERYLATLPSLHRNETWKDVGIHPPTGVVEKRVEKGLEPKSEAAIVFTGPFQFAPMPRVTIRAMAQVLENRLRETLREALGGTYSVSVDPSYSKIPHEEYDLSIDFGCSPDRTDDLVKTVFHEIELLKTTGPTDKQVADVRETLLRDFETNSKSNGYLLANISSRYEYGEELGTFFGIADLYKQLTPAMIQAAAKTYLNTNNYVKVTLFPEKK